jgi:subfamily B ATP-binding cassette protein MsbA
MTVYRRMIKLVEPHWRRLALAALCMVGTAVTTAASAYLLKPVADDIFISRQGNMLQILSLVVLLVFTVKGFCALGNAYLMNFVGQRIIADLRQQLYDHFQSLQLSFFEKTPTGVLMSRVTNDIGQMQSAVSDAFTGVFKDSLGFIGLAFVILYRDWQLAAISMLVLPLAFYPIVAFGRMQRKISTRSQESMGSLSVILHETISGARIVKAFSMEEYEKKRFAKENMRYFGHTMKSVAVRAFSSPLMEFLGGLGIVCMIWYGGSSVIQGKSTPGNFLSFTGALLMLYEPVKRLSNTNHSIQQGLAAATRVYEILDTRPEIQDRPNATQLGPLRECIQLENVHFAYGDVPVLTDINLKVKAGEIVAIVGVSGSGKTTLVNLIPRFYDVTSGALTVDGVDIRDVTIASLRAQVAIVTQQSILFNDTVRNNIAYGNIDRDRDDIIAAAKAANAYEFIAKMPLGFDTLIGEQGVRLSGGERQRICIARAILKNAPILILDEATSSLDSESELEVQKALENLMAGRTTFVIAHRLSTIKNADRIIAIANGRIVDEGSHDELLGGNGEYRRLYDLQLAQYEAHHQRVG